MTFSGQRARAQGQRVRYVTERCVLELLDAGLTVTEIAPGIDLHTDILGHIPFQVSVLAELKTMDAALFVPDGRSPALEFAS